MVSPWSLAEHPVLTADLLKSTCAQKRVCVCTGASASLCMCGVDRTSVSLIFFKILNPVFGSIQSTADIRDVLVAGVCRSFQPQGDLAPGDVGWGEWRHWRSLAMRSKRANILILNPPKVNLTTRFAQASGHGTRQDVNTSPTSSDKLICSNWRCFFG